MRKYASESILQKGKGEISNGYYQQSTSELAHENHLLNGLAFDDLILAAHCNCRTITPAAVRSELNEMLENNMDAIMDEARKGRS